jgi:organic hydroperoxide reductase OsmC/OhrA
MSEHRAKIRWRPRTPDFRYESYERDHSWELSDGLTLAASASPEYRGHSGRIDPESALVGALSSCHMLSFLAIAARRRLPVASYDDDAVGRLEKNAEGRLAVTQVVLRPQVRWAEGVVVTAEQVAAMHEQAHRECFIANSVKTEVTVEPAGHV